MDQVWLKRGEGRDIVGRGRVDTLGKYIWARAGQIKLASDAVCVSVALPSSPVLHYQAEQSQQ